MFLADRAGAGERSPTAAQRKQKSNWCVVFALPVRLSWGVTEQVSGVFICFGARIAFKGPVLLMVSV